MTASSMRSGRYLDCQRAGGWDLKRHVKIHRDKDGYVRYIKGYTPLGVDESRLTVTDEDVKVVIEKAPTKPQKIVLATVGADAHVNGINVIREAFMEAGYEIIFLRGMNLPETVLRLRRRPVRMRSASAICWVWVKPSSRVSGSACRNWDFVTAWLSGPAAGLRRRKRNRRCSTTGLRRKVWIPRRGCFLRTEQYAGAVREGD